MRVKSFYFETCRFINDLSDETAHVAFPDERYNQHRDELETCE